MTDHVGLLISGKLFEGMTGLYCSLSRAVSDTTTPMFSGTEMILGHSGNPPPTGDGHWPGCGISSVKGLNDGVWLRHAGPDKIDGNNLKGRTTEVSCKGSLTFVRVGPTTRRPRSGPPTAT